MSKKKIASKRSQRKTAAISASPAEVRERTSLAKAGRKPGVDSTDEFFDAAVARRRAEADAVFQQFVPPALAEVFEMSERFGALKPQLLEQLEEHEAQARLRLARIVFRNAVHGVALPDREKDAWLQASVAALRRSRTKTERRAMLLQTLETFEGDWEILRLDLADADAAFTTSKHLTDERLKRIVAKLSDKRAGATNRHAASIAAELSLSAGAFGDVRQKAESMSRAIERIAKSFRKARDAR